MDITKKVINKDVGVATAIGAGLGALAGAQNNKTASTALLGAGVGALVGIFGESLLKTFTGDVQPEPAPLEGEIIPKDK